MLPRFAIALLFVLAMTMVMGGAALAADKTHEGVMVSAADGKLVMTDKNGRNQHSHTVPATAKVTLNDKTVKLTDLQKGDAIKVTTNAQSVVITIAATRS